ncbi:bifunctional nicotinamidase/pyrazinamidase [Bizionia sediminis]|uniref:nicotinamidase n=1 Tax=Bizionia sediminis TaxID=1737064 RepID=A0ABW5KR41_9FLAO
MKTLLIIDAQNDFMPGGALPVPNGDAIVPVINAIQHKFDLVVASQDWHPSNHVSFASNHPNKAEFDEIEIFGKLQTLWPDHCVQNTQGAAFHKDLNTSRWEAIFRKGTDKTIDSYSAFYDNGQIKATGIKGYLKEKGTTQLYLCGLAADICVYYSIVDAVNAGFECTLIQDASKALDAKHFLNLATTLENKGVALITSDTL